MIIRWPNRIMITKIVVQYENLNVCSATVHLGGNITKSAIATPGSLDWQVNTVNIEGSFESYSQTIFNNEDDLLHDRM
jgi:hypothetical protein